jgi:LysR family transcriptional regulator, benzoate and cis,cis-muconate-responsive activator of ben and cat genes
MEIRHLRYFVTVAEEQNVTRAAARLHLTQPCLSRQIRDLEDEFSFALFERRARAIRLTDAGRVFLVEARAVLQRAAEAVQAAKAVALGRSSELHVGYADSLTARLLPQALRFFQADSDATRVTLHDLSTKEMLRRLQENRLDVALLNRPSDKALKGLFFEEFCREEVCIALNRGHRLARTRQIDLSTLGEERLIGYSRDEYPEYHHWLASIFQSPERRPSTSEEHDSSTGVIAAVEAGRGVALVQRGFEFLAGARVKVLPLVPAPASVVVGIAARRRGRTSPAVERFFSAVRQSTAA